MWPAETSPSARPSRTQLAAMRIEELRFLRIGGGRRVVHRDDLGRVHDLDLGAAVAGVARAAARAPPSCRRAGVEMPNSRAAAIAPSTLTGGAWSPPIASTAIRTLSLSPLQATRVRGLYEPRRQVRNPRPSARLARC